MLSFLRTIKNLFLDGLFPRICVSCRKYLTRTQYSTMCDRCFQAIPVHSTFFCSVCKARLPDNTKICHREAQFLLGAVSDYSSKELRDLIHSFKYSFSTEALHPLITLTEIYVRHLDFDFTDFIVIPIPLHKTRERSRGFNQSAILGKSLARILNIPFFQDGLQRVANTDPQVRMRDRAAREENVSEAFTVRASLDRFQNKNIILVDDVFTSGATLREAVRVLKSCGAKKVVAFVIAKA